MTLTVKILIGMFAGIALGVLVNVSSFFIASDSFVGGFIHGVFVEGILDTVGQIFVRLLKLLIVPMVFVSLVLGSAALGTSSRMGPMAAKTICLYLLTTCIAITLAMTAALLVKPGNGVDLKGDEVYEVRDAPPLKEVVIDIFPANPVQAMAEANMLQLIVFSILMGIALVRVGEKGEPVMRFFESVNEVILKMVLMLMHLAPYGVFAILAVTFSRLGLELIYGLLGYFMTVLTVLLLHAGLVYGGLLTAFAGLSPVHFFRNIRPAILFAFSTASSSATLPVTMEVARDRLGIKRAVSAFTLPLGATINMDGTAIMQGVATVFIAQVYGIDIGLSGYLIVILTATLASIGTAGVPGVGILMLSMVLGQVGLPVEGIALIIGVDRLLDMVRTAVNVTGDSMVATVVAKSEKEFDVATYTENSDIKV